MSAELIYEVDIKNDNSYQIERIITEHQKDEIIEKILKYGKSEAVFYKSKSGKKKKQILPQNHKPKMKIAIVTGASSGLGKIFVDNLIQEKDLDQIRVLSRSKDKLNELKTQYGDKIVSYTIDLSVHDEIIKFSKKLTETKCRIRYLVNNAGYGKFGASDEIPLEDSLNMIDFYLTGMIMLPPNHLLKVILWH